MWGGCVWKFPACTLNLVCKAGPGRSCCLHRIHLCAQHAMLRHHGLDKHEIKHRRRQTGNDFGGRLGRYFRSRGSEERLWIRSVPLLESGSTTAALGPRFCPSLFSVPSEQMWTGPTVTLVLYFPKQGLRELDLRDPKPGPNISKLQT